MIIFLRDFLSKILNQVLSTLPQGVECSGEMLMNQFVPFI